VNTFHLGYKNQSIYAVSGTSRCLFWDKHKTHKYSVGRAYSCWMLNLFVHHVTSSFYKVKVGYLLPNVFLQNEDCEGVALYRVIRNFLQDVRHLQYSSWDGHAEGEHVNGKRSTPRFCPTLQVLDIPFLLCLSWLLCSWVWKFRRDLWITLY
jgi:hypothetical protein